MYIQQFLSLVSLRLSCFVCFVGSLFSGDALECRIIQEIHFALTLDFVCSWQNNPKKEKKERKSIIYISMNISQLCGLRDTAVDVKLRP